MECLCRHLWCLSVVLSLMGMILNKVTGGCHKPLPSLRTIFSSSRLVLQLILIAFPTEIPWECLRPGALLTRTIEGNEREVLVRACKCSLTRETPVKQNVPQGGNDGLVQCVLGFSAPRKDTVYRHDFTHACHQWWEIFPGPFEVVSTSVKHASKLM